MSILTLSILECVECGHVECLLLRLNILGGVGSKGCYKGSFALPSGLQYYRIGFILFAINQHLSVRYRGTKCTSVDASQTVNYILPSDCLLFSTIRQ